MTVVKRNRPLSYKEGKFIEGMTKGLNQKDSAIYAGYSPLSASVSASKLMKREKILKVLEKAGLTDSSLANAIRVNMEEGLGVKATADTSLKAVELALKLKGYLQNDKVEANVTNNTYIETINNMTDEQLEDRIRVLQGSTIVEN
jgi:phage terminase small subunit